MPSHTRPAHVLVVDDPLASGRVAASLRASGHEVTLAATAADARRAAGETRPDAVLLEPRLPDGDGLALLDHLLALDGAPAVVVVAAEATVDAAVEAMRRGAADFLAKPVASAALQETLERALAGRPGSAETPLPASPAIPALIGTSPAVRRVLQQVARAAAAPRATVFARGESGTGKELVARAIHAASRPDGPFVVVACAALDPGLVGPGEPNGFDRLLATAAGGTLFLDEAGELSAALQAGVLRSLQAERGAADGARGDVRIVSSTRRDLSKDVARGSFRADLFYRLNVLSIDVPPLRERLGDVPALAAHFLGEAAREHGRSLDGFAEAALGRLQRHTWPGNVRELRNAVERAVLVTDTGRIRAESLSLAATGTAHEPERPADLSLQSVEAAHIRRVLRETGGNRSRAARLLGVNRTTLYSKLRRYDIAV